MKCHINPHKRASSKNASSFCRMGNKRQLTWGWLVKPGWKSSSWKTGTVNTLVFTKIWERALLLPRILKGLGYAGSYHLMHFSGEALLTKSAKKHPTNPNPSGCSHMETFQGSQPPHRSAALFWIQCFSLEPCAILPYLLGLGGRRCLSLGHLALVP